MEVIDTSRFRRSREDLLECFDIKEETTLVTKDISIVIPERYVDKGLCVFKDTVEMVCIYGILDKAKGVYATASNPTIHNFSPSDRKDIVIDNEPYIELVFYKGDQFTPSNTTIVSSTRLFTLFDLFFMQGKVPFYLSYEDLGKIFLPSAKYTGVKLDSSITNELMATLIARNTKNLNQFVKNMDIKDTKAHDAVTFLGLNDTFYGFDNTTSRLIGNYLTQCMTSAIIDPDRTPNKIGNILKK